MIRTEDMIIKTGSFLRQKKKQKEREKEKVLALSYLQLEIVRVFVLTFEQINRYSLKLNLLFNKTDKHSLWGSKSRAINLHHHCCRSLLVFYLLKLLVAYLRVYDLIGL